MTFTDMRLKEYMNKPKKALQVLFIYYCITLPECMTLAEMFATTIFSVKLMHDCITNVINQ